MSVLKKASLLLSQNKIHLLFIGYFLIHILLLNVNAIEWGDSYRILRAAKSIRETLSYPADEKRPPFFSMLLATYPTNFDPLLWGRLVLMTISLASFWIFYKLSTHFLKDRSFLAMLLFVLNPVYFYWSLRVMADVPFSFLVLLVFYLLVNCNDSGPFLKLSGIGILCGVAILTRFEGYVLLASVLGGEVFSKRIKGFKNALIILACAFLVATPYLVSWPPFKSSYLSETRTMVYNIESFFSYFFSLIFLFGVVPAALFFYKYKKDLTGIYAAVPHVYLFVIAELLLILLWPAAVPRLFVAIIPLLLIPLASFIARYLESSDTFTKSELALLLALLISYPVSILTLKLQFLITTKWVLALSLLLQLGLVVTLVFKKRKLAITFMVFGLLVWSLGVVWSHKDIYRSLVEASIYAKENLNGKIGYSDMNEVSPWYLGDQGYEIRRTRQHRNYDFDRTYKAGVRYVLVSDELNNHPDFAYTYFPEMVQIKEIKHLTNGKSFYTKIFKLVPVSESDAI